MVLLCFPASVRRDVLASRYSSTPESLGGWPCGFLAADSESLCGRFMLGFGLLLPGEVCKGFWSQCRGGLGLCEAEGCPSWTWFYPYHYAPATQKLHDIWNTTSALIQNILLEAVCIRLDWLWQPEMWWDQLFSDPWLRFTYFNFCFQSLMIWLPHHVFIWQSSINSSKRLHLKILSRNSFSHQIGALSRQAGTTFPTFPAAYECFAACQCRGSYLAVPFYSCTAGFCGENLRAVAWPGRLGLWSSKRLGTQAGIPAAMRELMKQSFSPQLDLVFASLHYALAS